MWAGTVFCILQPLSAVDPSLYEAATMDGASKWQKLVNIDIPMLLPTATIMFILRTGSIMSVGFEKVYLLLEYPEQQCEVKSSPPMYIRWVW